MPGERRGRSTRSTRGQAAWLTTTAHAVFLLLLGSLAVACPQSKLTPSITVTSSPTTLTISGTGFANVSSCAHLSLLGTPPLSAHASIGDPPCTGGSFQNYTWVYSHDGDGCPGGGPAVVIATDPQGSNAGTSQPVSLASKPENCGKSCCSDNQKCADPFTGICCGLDEGMLCGHTGDGRGGERCCAPGELCTPDACCKSEVVCGLACLPKGASCCNSYPVQFCPPGQSCCGSICCPSGTSCTTVGGVTGCL
jgi:hypothetical protein